MNGIAAGTPEVAAPEEPVAVEKTNLVLRKPDEPQLIHYENGQIDLDFSTIGGTVTRLVYKGERVPYEIGQHDFYEGDLTRSGLFAVTLMHDPVDLSQTVFEPKTEGLGEGVFEFLYEKPGDYRLTKRFSVLGNAPVVLLEVFVENLSGRGKIVPVELGFGLNYDPADKAALPSVEAVAETEKIESAPVGKIEKKGFSTGQEVIWAGAKLKYYSMLIKPNLKAAGVSYQADAFSLTGKFRMAPAELAAAGKTQWDFFIYAGPNRYEVLKSFDMGFEQILSKGFFGMLKIWFLIALKFFYRYTHNYGWAIILLTCLIKLVFTPLTHMSFQSMKKMQAIQPKMKSLQERYKSDPQRLNKEMMELYKRNKVNPMGGCLPMLLQIPIFIAFYQVLADAIELKGAGFLGWIHDLSAPDRLFTMPFSLPFIGDSFNLLPLLMIGSMVWQQKLTPQTGTTPEQTKMMTFMPLIFGFMFYNMPSGLVLYWFLNNMLSIVHQLFVKRIVVTLHHEDAE